jgi:hypothetical protein
MTDRDLKEQMARFEAARIGAPVELSPAKVARVVAVHDGTDQDATVDALAAAIAGRTGAGVETLTPRSEDGDPLPALLAAAGTGDVVVVPSPFGRDYQSEGRLSLSTRRATPPCASRGRRSPTSSAA